MPEAKILIVEDEAIESMDVQQRLVGLGYPLPDIAYNGEEGVRMVEEARPDLVLMDIMMPGKLDGVAAAEQIRSRFDIPIIFLTAYADENTLRRAKITSPYGYILKPFQERELHITVDMALYRHKMERKLKEREKWLATTLRSIGDAVIATDEKGLITFMNPVAEELLGWNIEEVRQRTLTEVFNIVNRDTRRPAENPVARVLLEGNIVGLANHTVLISRTGKEIPINDSAAPIKDEKGNILGVILVFSDITEQEKTQEALRESQRQNEFLADLISASSQPVGIGYADGRLGFVNRAFEELTGYAADELRSIDWATVLTPSEWRDMEQDRLAELHRTGRPVRYEKEYIRKDGTRVPIELLVHLVTDDGKPQYYYAFVTDITKRKRAEEALRKAHDELELRVQERTKELKEAHDTLEQRVAERTAELQAANMSLRESRRATLNIMEDAVTARRQAEEISAELRQSEEKYHTLFDTLIEGFCTIEMIFDADNRPVDYRFLEINPVFEKQTGLHNAQGKLMRDLASEHETHLFEIYGKIALTGEPAHFENEAKALGRYYDVSAYRVGGPESRKVAILFNDITERKKSEADILKLSEDMATRNRELESVNKELEAFIYSISHDLRAPIRTMSGFAKIISEEYAGKLDQKGQDYLNRILKGSTKSIQLIDDLLHLSKISRQELDRIETDLSKRVSKIVEQLREMNQGRNVEVVVQEGLSASADPRLIELALSNLIGNAWKFTSKTEKARIEFGSIVNDGKTVYYVKDNGAGFDMTYADKMFWPFHRLHTDREFEGTGIGLTIVERVIRRHGGKAWAEGEVGKGAVFYFTLG